MLAEWSVECSPEDPVLTVPWQDPNSPAAFIDLRANPYDLAAIPEAEQHPPLLQALRALNAPRSPVFTAKCDAWPLDLEELEQLHIDLELDLDTDPTQTSMSLPCGFASYIDLVWRDRAIFTSFHRQEQTLQRLTRLAAPLHHPTAALDCILRPAFVDLGVPQEGFAVSLYIKALGPDPRSAWDEWAAALTSCVALVRGPSFTPRTRTPKP